MISGIKGAIKARKGQEKPPAVVIIGLWPYRILKCFHTFPYFPNFPRLAWTDFIIRQNQECHKNYPYRVCDNKGNDFVRTLRILSYREKNIFPLCRKKQNLHKHKKVEDY